jgi:branched-chain amino acid transport system permease protein
VPPTERPRLGRLEAGGHAIAYAESGAGATGVLLVHGNFASKRWFGPLLGAPPAARLVALDLPGFGDSGPLAGAVSIDAYARALRAAADALGLERPALVGHSLGGNVAMVAVANDPDAWSSLALVSSGAPAGLVTAEGVYPILEAYRADRALLARSLAAIMPTATPTDFDALVDDALRMQPAGFAGNSRALAALSQRPGLDPTPRLATFTGPVLVLRGGMDTLITAEMAAATAAAFPASSDVRCETWDDVGHSPPLEQPARFRDRLAEFLAGAAPPTAPPPTAPREAP